VAILRGSGLQVRCAGLRLDARKIRCKSTPLRKGPGGQRADPQRPLPARNPINVAEMNGVYLVNEEPLMAAGDHNRTRVLVIDGYGLGLAIARKIVDAHLASIVVSGTGECGTVFHRGKLLRRHSVCR
jgi:hypothetical protein